MAKSDSCSAGVLSLYLDSERHGGRTKLIYVKVHCKREKKHSTPLDAHLFSEVLTHEIIKSL